MKTKKRFHFWKIFWVVLALYLFVILLGIIIIWISPSTGKPIPWEKMLQPRKLLDNVTSLLFASFFYYLALNSYYRLISERRSALHYIRPTLLLIGCLLAYFVLDYFLFSSQVLNVEVKSESGIERITLGLMIFSYVFIATFYLGLSLLIAYFTNLRDEKKQRKVLEEQKMQLEVEKSQANFNFLKAQINPHFLHNTLNFLYAKSLPYSPELSEGILTLSDIMRYALSEGNARDGKAPLKDEIEHVRNVIKINQLRFSNNLNVQFEVEGIVNGATIIPFVLITLVENAFKHGDLKSSENPIIVRTRILDDQLYFYCRNKKKMGPKELSTGIGLDNIKKRLDLAYGKDYALNVKDEAEFYTTELTISKL
ncbi:MAG TPA: histidine kinase [Flavisolibacter sp.]|nr:histidine kinase [Flavisolibacter sp.]